MLLQEAFCIFLSIFQTKTRKKQENRVNTQLSCLINSIDTFDCGWYKNEALSATVVIMHRRLPHKKVGGVVVLVKGINQGFWS